MGVKSIPPTEGKLKMDEFLEEFVQNAFFPQSKI
jgi:hypothetical protein